MVSKEELDKIEKVFGSKTEVVSRYTPMYPYSCERELKRVMVSYANSLTSEVRKKFPEMARIYKTQRDIDQGIIREDGLMDLRGNLLDSLVSISDEVEGKDKQMDKLVTKIGKMTSKHVTNEWNKSINKTFMVEHDTDLGSLLFTTMLAKFWAEVKTRMLDMKTKLTDKILSMLTSAYQKGLSMTDAFKRLGKELSKLKRKAGMEARDIIGSLSSGMEKEAGEHFGCGSYVWCTKRDDRVRECHRTVDGRIFQWNNPPEMWYRRGGTIVWTGRRCNPGEDYGCRCVAKTVYSLDGIRRIFGL